MATRKGKVDAVYDCAQTLRQKGGIPYASAKLEMEDDGARVEFFRGKDAARHLRAHPELMANLVAPTKPGRDVDDQIADLMSILLRRELIKRAERKFKKPKPGKKRLVKFPKTLLALSPQEATVWREDGFYVWMFDRPTSPMFYLMSALLLLGVILVTLFPLAPYWFRMYSVYIMMGILGFLLGLIGVRYVIWLAVWIISGRSFWFLPNLTSEDIPITEAFFPVVTFTKLEGGKKQLLYRVIVLLAAAGVVYSLYHYSPEQAKLRANAQKAHDSLLEFLEKFGKAEKQQITGSGSGDKSEL